jgi:CHAT domain-containing protein
VIPQQTVSLDLRFVKVRKRRTRSRIPSPDCPASAEDDGLLKISDVTGLKLNADWVVMSACNTVGGAEGGEALSGLAKAFFYAGSAVAAGLPLVRGV